MLLSLPDNDWYSHKHGVGAQPVSIAQADLQLTRVMEAAGGVEEFLEQHAVIVMADHSQADVKHAVVLQDELAELDVLGPGGPKRGEREPRIAVCPSQRAAMVYLLAEERREELLRAVVRRVLGIEGVELVMWLEGGDASQGEGVIAGARGELRFAPGGEVHDLRGRSWSVSGKLEVIDGELLDGLLAAPGYPDVLSRVWSGLTCRTSGEVLLSAAAGWEFADWGRQAHVGGGSHGSLRAEDSLGALLLHGVEGLTGPPVVDGCEQPQWAIRDVADAIGAHYGLERLQPPA
jgi:hypothetical protein